MTEIEIKHEKPPIYQKLHDTFRASWDDGVIIAWEGKIYCKFNPPPQKIYHEHIHLQEQEKLGNEVWWRLYLDDKDFRFKEELKAYKAEADFIKKAVKNKNDRFEMIRIIAHDFASELYGKLLTPQEAFDLIT